MNTANRIVTASPRQSRVMYRNGDTADIMRVILYADRQSAQYIRAGAANHLKGRTDRETLRNIYWLVKNNIQYRADRRGHEVVKGPAYLFDAGEGDCKSMSIAIAAMCRAAGIPYRYRFSATRQGIDYHHVYVIATDRATGADVAMDAVYNDFDQEPPHKKRLDIDPSKSRGAIAGLGAITDGSWILIVLFALWLLLAKKVR